jgi:hypothetical protein
MNATSAQNQNNLTATTSASTPNRICSAQHPALAQLRLTDDDLLLLARQGFVSTEVVRGMQRHKLRFRRADGRQVVRYVAAAELAAVRTELDQLQAPGRVLAEIRKSTRAVSQSFRSWKKRVSPVVSQLGFEFHGRTLRRSRQLKS